MRIYIKDLISVDRRRAVKAELLRLGYETVYIDTGAVDISPSPDNFQRQELRFALAILGFELLESKKDILLQEIKSLIIRLVYQNEAPPTYNLSVYLSGTLGYDYTYMSNLFSERLRITIEKFYIFQKIERVKDLLLYEELTLTEIAHKMHYSSLGHLSGQFKKITGLNPSQFIQQKRLASLQKLDVYPTVQETPGKAAARQGTDKT